MNDEPVERITHAQAAALLGCHVSNISKLVQTGQLVSIGRCGPGAGTLDRAQVEQVAAERAVAEAEGRLRYDRVDPQRKGPPPELGDHEWLTPDQVGQRLGVTGTAVRFRAARNSIPHIRHGKRIWIRADHLEVRPGCVR